MRTGGKVGMGEAGGGVAPGRTEGEQERVKVGLMGACGYLEEKMEKLRLVTYCGLYCDLCAQHGRIPHQANALRDSMRREGYEYWGRELPNFREFWSFLEGLCDPDGACPGCRQGGGPPFCGIRKCAQKRGIEVCGFCEEYPCERVMGLGKGYPTLVADGRRMREIGLEAWIEEQEERATTGFAYVDIRCHPYEVPGE